MMSWLRAPPFPFARAGARAATLDPRSDYEPVACFQTFCKHWQQALQMMQRTQGEGQKAASSLQDEVLAVVSHVEQTATLLTLEARARDLRPAAAPSPPACLEHLLAENLLQRLYDWSEHTGRYVNAVRVEQLKLYGALVSSYSANLVAAEPFLRPLLRLLRSCAAELLPTNVEEELVALLSQLSVLLMQDVKLLDLFFVTTDTPNGIISEFLPVRLLLGCVHREGAAGAAARDAMLLCASMSGRHQPLAEYMLRHGNVCVVLATGLSGLYSLLPRALENDAAAATARLTPDDVNRIPKLPLFISSLEFCNAVAQVAHPDIRRTLVDFLHQGFLVPVLGPALLQSRALQSGAAAAERAAAAAYLELCARSATPRGLLRPLLRFVLAYRYDGARLLDALLGRLHDRSQQVALVSLSLVETLLELNCEDVMLELVLRHLRTPPPTHREKMLDSEPYREGAAAFLSLAPECCARPPAAPRAPDASAGGGGAWERRDSDGGDEIAMTSLVRARDNGAHYSNPNESLMGNFNAYLCDARHKIAKRTLACSNWSSKYDGCEDWALDSPPPSGTECTTSPAREQHGLVSLSTNAYERIRGETREQNSLTSLGEGERTAASETANGYSSGREQDSLTSLGESSGYESFKYRVDEQEEVEDAADYAEDSFWRRSVGANARRRDDVQSSTGTCAGEEANTEYSVGPLLSALFAYVPRLLQLEPAAALQVTGLLSMLASFPAPALASLLLCPGLQPPGQPSLYQMLYRLKREADEVTRGCGDASAASLVDAARAYLVRRELRLAHCTHAHAHTTTHAAAGGSERAAFSPEAEAAGAAGAAAGAGARRGDNKRRSLSSSLTSMFARRLHATGVEAVGAAPAEDPSSGEYWAGSAARRTVLNAVLLDEWLRELAALALEHALLRSGPHHPRRPPAAHSL